jgi:hypothetical protein
MAEKASGGWHPQRIPLDRPHQTKQLNSMTQPNRSSEGLTKIRQQEQRRADENLTTTEASKRTSTAQP